MDSDRISEAEEIIHRSFARTGVLPDEAADPARRYLWTDAYALFALIELHGLTGRDEHLARAEHLAALVHRVLGRHRPDDDRVGWISGRSELEGAAHPTSGGLRIGKPLPERRAEEPLRERMEWERDGQYFHYLVKWMLALDRLARATANPRWSMLAVELARFAHRAFVAPREEGRPRRMYWKMSIDGTRPLVASMGHHDPLDGLVTAWRLGATCRELGAHESDLAELVQDYRLMCDEFGIWSTHDALGIGGLLASLAELVDLTSTERIPFDPLLLRVAAAADRSLASPHLVREFGAPPAERLAFRELGLSIGLHGVGEMAAAIDRRPELFGGRLDRAVLRAHVAALASRAELAERIEISWRSPAARRDRSWVMHEDINAVMLAVSLLSQPRGPRSGRPTGRLSETA